MNKIIMKIKQNLAIKIKIIPTAIAFLIIILRMTKILKMENNNSKIMKIVNKIKIIMKMIMKTVKIIKNLNMIYPCFAKHD